MFCLRNLPFLLLSSTLLLVGIFNNRGEGGVSVCSAFTPPTRIRHRKTLGGLVPLKSLPPTLMISEELLQQSTSLTTTSSIIVANNEDIPLEDAFQDSISLMDGPVGLLLAAFGVFVVLAVGLKAVMGQMDDAIEKVILDFETTLKAEFPKRWKVIEEMELKGLAGDERDIKLLQVMERLQQEEPEFMSQVANRSGNKQPAAGGSGGGLAGDGSEVVDAEVISSSSSSSFADDEYELESWRKKPEEKN